MRAKTYPSSNVPRYNSSTGACPTDRVTAGSITVRYEDGTEEVSRAGDLYHWPAGHTGWTDEGVTFIEFSPADDLRPVLEHVAAQLAPTT